MNVISMARYVISGALVAWLGITPAHASSNGQKESGTRAFLHIRFYNDFDAKGDNSCTITMHDLPTHGVVRLKDNVTGCGPAYNKAKSMKIENLPAASKITLYTHVDCGDSKPWAELTVLQADPTRPYALIIGSLNGVGIPAPGGFNPKYWTDVSGSATASIRFHLTPPPNIFAEIAGKLKCVEYDVH